MRRTLGLLAAAALLPACEPDDVPRFSADGKQAAFLADAGLDPEKDPVPIGVVDLGSGKIRKFPLPDRWIASGVVWVGSRLWVSSTRPTGRVDDLGKPEHDLASWLLDPQSGKAEATDLKALLGSLPFAGTFQGKACLYVPGPDRLRILDLPGLKEVGGIDGDLEPAGDGWLAAKESRDSANGLTRDLVAIRILDTEGKEVGKISREEIAKSSYRDARFPECVRISENRKRVLLGFDTSTRFRQMDAEYTFGVYDLASGMRVFGGKSNALRGVPVLVGEVVYALEAKSREIWIGERGPSAILDPGPQRSAPVSEVVLARHDAKGRTVVLEIPLGKGSKANRYSASDDRKRFILQVHGLAPRLLVIPVGEAVTADQVRTIKLD